MALTFHRGELGRDDVQQLLALHVAAMRSQSPPNACHVLAPSGLDDPAISFLTARKDGELACVGALKSLRDGAGELKSMRVAPGFAGMGVGRAVLGALLTEARGLGVRRLLLETGRSPGFAAANRLYDRAGFVERGPFGHYTASDFTRFMQLEL